MDGREIALAVAAHKPYWMPRDPMYLPVQVGASGKTSIDGFTRDDKGENISSSNSRYCELTGLWWVWKNVKAEAVGLVHYRRHFAGSGERGTLTSDEAAELLKRAPLVLPKKRHYVIETNGDHYAHTHDANHLRALHEAVEEVCPEYADDLGRHLRERSGHMLNMILARSDVLDDYLSWLFPVLDAAEARIDFSVLTPFQERCMGRLSEFLIDVWVSHTATPFVECSVSDMEAVDWMQKGSAFLAAKFFGKKYEGSF